MPPFSGAPALLPGFSRKAPAEPNIVSLNVGGQLFQTTPQTLALAGPASFLVSLSSSPAPTFVDRDPDLFSVLLSLLRTGRLPAKAESLDLQDLIAEAEFYGLGHLLVSSLADASRFDPFDLRRSAVLPLNGRDPPSAVSTTPFGSIHVAHGCKVTSFDWSLRRKSTVLTCFPAVDSLLALSPSIAAAGATDFPGLRIVDLGKGAVKKALHWSAHPSATGGSTVQGIGASSDLLFGSFESSRRNASAIVAFDLVGGTVLPVAEIGRREIYGAELESAIPATKLRWIPSRSLLMAAGSHAGPSGLQGTIRLWDVRSPGDAAVWELKENSDCFADVAVSDALSSIFKVGVNSGELYMADLRKLGDSWACLGDPRRASGTGRKEGSGCTVESYGEQVFCSRGEEVEMWSEVLVAAGGNVFAAERLMRRNVLGRGGEAAEGKITALGFGGTRMVVARKGLQGVEVWESSNRS